MCWSRELSPPPLRATKYVHALRLPAVAITLVQGRAREEQSGGDVNDGVRRGAADISPPSLLAQLGGISALRPGEAPRTGADPALRPGEAPRTGADPVPLALGGEGTVGLGFTTGAG
ncbi:unnamed protein product [Rangifer tarandus platyrhynchus]|uniref:Uncharacterized protein n=1 Tax=Rangifer tarandus platyrhynchus TaxID=3082113 RepID=A0AC59YHB6_RANTA